MRNKINQELIAKNPLLVNFLTDPYSLTNAELDQVLNLNYNRYSIYYIESLNQLISMEGAVNVLNFLKEKRPDKLQEKKYSAYRFAVEYGRLDVLKFFEGFDEDIQEIIAHNSYGVLLSAVQYDQSEVLEYLAQIVDTQNISDEYLNKIINWCLFGQNIDASGILLLKVPEHFHLKIQTNGQALILSQVLNKYSSKLTGFKITYTGVLDHESSLIGLGDISTRSRRVVSSTSYGFFEKVNSSPGSNSNSTNNFEPS